MDVCVKFGVSRSNRSWDITVVVAAHCRWLGPMDNYHSSAICRSTPNNALASLESLSYSSIWLQNVILCICLPLDQLGRHSVVVQVQHCKLCRERSRGDSTFGVLWSLWDLGDDLSCLVWIRCFFQENSKIRELQQENKELRQSLDEHQSALELIMSKYRLQLDKLAKANSIERTLLEHSHDTASSVSILTLGASCWARAVGGLFKPLLRPASDSIYFFLTHSNNNDP